MDSPEVAEEKERMKRWALCESAEPLLKTAFPQYTVILENSGSDMEPVLDVRTGGFMFGKRHVLMTGTYIHVYDANLLETTEQALESLGQNCIIVKHFR